jgi:hypothetical protein
MSGADFRFTGRLTFADGKAIPGCARAATDPPSGEPGEPR